MGRGILGYVRFNGIHRLEGSGTCRFASHKLKICLLRSMSLQLSMIKVLWFDKSARPFL